MSEAYIIDAVRTPRAIGKVGKGALASLHPQYVAATVLKALAERNALQTADIDDVIWGTSAQMGIQGGDMGRMAALDAGFDISVSGVTLDRFCGSGLTAVSLAAAQIKSEAGRSLDCRRHRDDVVRQCLWAGVAGSRRQVAWRAGLRQPPAPKRYPQSNQGVCADAVASMEGITRNDVDAIGVMSQERAAQAIKEGASSVPRCPWSMTRAR